MLEFMPKLKQQLVCKDVGLHTFKTEEVQSIMDNKCPNNDHVKVCNPALIQS